MAALNAIVFDALPPGMRAGHMVKFGRRGEFLWKPARAKPARQPARPVIAADELTFDAPSLAELVPGWSRL